jgi:integrase
MTYADRAIDFASAKVGATPVPRWCHSPGPAAVYLARLGSGSRRTQAAALRAILHHLSPGWTLSADDYPWHLATAEQLMAVRARLVNDRAPATARRMLAAIRGVMQECWRLGLLDREELARRIDMPPVRGSRTGRGTHATVEQVARLYGALRAKYGHPDAHPQRWAAVDLMVYAGLRRGEVVGLRPEDVTRCDDRVALRVRGKGDKERVVYLAGEPARRVLLAKAAALDAGHARLVWYRTAGALWWKLERLCLLADLPHLRPHDLRRTFAGRALDAGVDLATVQKALGHADPRTTATYDRRGAAALQSLADTLADAQASGG